MKNSMMLICAVSLGISLCAGVSASAADEPAFTVDSPFDLTLGSTNYAVRLGKSVRSNTSAWYDPETKVTTTNWSAYGSVRLSAPYHGVKFVSLDFKGEERRLDSYSFSIGGKKRGIGGRLRVKSTPINGWSAFASLEEKGMQEIANEPDLKNSIQYFGLEIESDHITEFAADAGIYFSLPLSSRFAIGSKLLIGRSIMDDIDVSAKFLGTKMNYINEDYIPTDETAYTDWDYIRVSATNSMKFGTGLSFTYSYKNSFSWRLFCDYDYAKKTYTASYSPFIYLGDFCPDLVNMYIERENWNPLQTFTSSTQKRLHQWVLGGALCVSF